MKPAAKHILPVRDLKGLADEARYWAGLAAAIPQPFPPIIEWSEANVELNGAKGKMFSSAETPWTRLPIELCFQPTTRKVTFIKPTRTGGSAAGHVVLCGWTRLAMGQIQYNWPTDEKAEDIWDKEACEIFKRTLRCTDRILKKGLIIFPNCTLSMQGVYSPSALDSDTIPYQVNEEIHNWAHGMLDKAYGRGDACDFPIRFNISNAGVEGDQLHTAYKDGTMRQWEVACPGCGNINFEANRVYHTMRVRWDERHPEHGGLWYDREKAKRPDGSYDYNIIARTIHYKMPCGHQIPNDITARRALSDSGRYSAPYNTGALPGEESMTYQAVAAHTMDWVNIIKRRNNALRARRTGDEDSYKKYVQEVECEFYSPDKIPFTGRIVISSGITKNRAGLANRACRVAFADWQQGYKGKGQLIHYWLVIEDICADLNSQIVFEGMINSDSELLTTLKEFEVEPLHTLIDASKNTRAILQLCYQQGFKAVMGNASHVGTFRDHEDKVPRYYSAGKPIHKELGPSVPPIYEYQFGPRQSNGDVLMVPDSREPLVIMYNLGGLLANHFFIRELKSRVTAACAEEKPPRQPRPDEYFERIIPADISEEFLKQYHAWERVGKDAKAKSGDVKSPGAEAFRQAHPDDHMLQCLAGIDLFKDWSYMLGDALANLGLEPQTEATK